MYRLAAAGADGSPGAVLDAYRTALVVPVIMVLLGAAVSAFGLRSARPAGRLAGGRGPRRGRRRRPRVTV
ncbi:hypothetical protein [Nonomuraea sp. NPDC049709]|uniref:hypothetical protein n=1 Tax=Nonomuraea sp. NPDC049709 TaxID=3154736 RepID=UPI0034341B31